MLPHRHIGNTRPEQWLGLVDGLYAIAMTLLALDAPSTFFKYLKLFIDKSNSSFLLRGIFSITAYILVFLVIYELWCYHRSTLNSLRGEFVRRQNLISGLLMAMVCLIPAWTSFLLKTHVDYYLGVRQFSGLPESIVLLIGPLLAALSFWLISRLCPGGETEQSTAETRAIYRSAMQRAYLFLGMSVYFYFNSLEPIRTVQLAFDREYILLAYILYSFNQDYIHNLFRKLPWNR